MVEHPGCNLLPSKSSEGKFASARSLQMNSPSSRRFSRVISLPYNGVHAPATFSSYRAEGINVSLTTGLKAFSRNSSGHHTHLRRRRLRAELLLLRRCLGDQHRGSTRRAIRTSRATADA